MARLRRSDPPAGNPRTAGGASPRHCTGCSGAARALEPRFELDLQIDEAHVLDVEPCVVEEGTPLLLRVVPHVSRIAETLRLPWFDSRLSVEAMTTE